MAQFSVNAQRFDPYPAHKFRVKWDGRYITGISRVSGLIRTTDVNDNRTGSDPSSPRLSPGQTEFAPITLWRGVSHDKEFEQWANKVWNYGEGLGGEVSLKDFRKDITIELLNESGQVAIAYRVFRCWPTGFEALPELDAQKCGVAIQSITLANEGWERDYDVAEPTEQSFLEPS
jgi:phage tail-like protein